MRRYIWAILLSALVSAGCQNACAKSFGGTMTVALPKGEKLVTCTWKNSTFWYLTRPMYADETPETYTFREQSDLGIVEGTVILKESR